VLDSDLIKKGECKNNIVGVRSNIVNLLGSDKLDQYRLSVGGGDSGFELFLGEESQSCKYYRSHDNSNHILAA